MENNIRRVEYFYTTVEDQPGEAYKTLSWLAELGINLLAFTAVPAGIMRTQLCLFPEDPAKLINEAKKARLNLEGPHLALMVQGDDRLGALAEVHEKLYQAHVNVSASSGISDGKCCYTYIIYVRPEEYEKAAQALEI
ncbi:hypothetical protein JW964_14855 [candidate division KSB1 bacterium]|nr:hypothetical protein [candidate division KSB1 bacterium]